MDCNKVPPVVALYQFTLVPAGDETVKAGVVWLLQIVTFPLLIALFGPFEKEIANTLEIAEQKLLLIFTKSCAIFVL